MNPDLAMVIGIVLAVLSVPSILSAWSEGRAPRVAAVTAIASGALIVWAIQTSPVGYTFLELPEVFVRVVARYLN